MNAQWCRLWHEMPTDPKWRVVARKSGASIPEVLAVFVLMLTTASAAQERGTLAQWDDEDAAAALDMDTETVAAIRGAMQGKVLDGDRVGGWDRRQPKREEQEPSGASTERVRAHRERVKQEAVSPAAPVVAPDVTTCNDTKRHETTREDKRREEENLLLPQTPSRPGAVAEADDDDSENAKRPSPPPSDADELYPKVIPAVAPWEQPLPLVVVEALHGCPAHWEAELRAAWRRNGDRIGHPTQWLCKVVAAWKRGENPPPEPPPPPPSEEDLAARRAAAEELRLRQERVAAISLEAARERLRGAASPAAGGPQ